MMHEKMEFSPENLSWSDVLKYANKIFKDMKNEQRAEYIIINSEMAKLYQQIYNKRNNE